MTMYLTFLVEGLWSERVVMTAADALEHLSPGQPSFSGSTVVGQTYRIPAWGRTESWAISYLDAC